MSERGKEIQQQNEGEERGSCPAHSTRGNRRRMITIRPGPSGAQEPGPSQSSSSVRKPKEPPSTSLLQMAINEMEQMAIHEENQAGPSRRAEKRPGQPLPTVSKISVWEQDPFQPIYDPKLRRSTSDSSLSTNEEKSQAGPTTRAQKRKMDDPNHGQKKVPI